MIRLLVKERCLDFVRRAFHPTCKLRCGVLSYFYYSPYSNDRSDDDYQSLLNGLNTLKHRGPDCPPGLWQNNAKSVGLGHTRLSIIDLSAHGRQPMHSYDNKLHLSMNGELYDHDRLRKEGINNDQYQFLSESDSEIAFYLYRKYDLQFTKYLRGEFAFTMYDEERKVYLGIFYILNCFDDLYMF